MKSFIRGVLQIAVLMAFSLILNAVVSWLHLPVPGSIIGMLILLFCCKPAWSG